MFASYTISDVIRPLRAHQRVTVLIGLWALAMVSLPVIKWIWGPEILRTGLVMGVTFQATAVFFILLAAWGWRETVKTAVFIAAATLTIEIIGSTTGFPFGHYTYTDLLQPQVIHVPLLIPMAWFMMLPAAWATVARYRPNRWLFALLSAAALTAWDLFLDPQMVAWGLWTWDAPGGYFGIPWTNYLGWLLTAVFITAVMPPKPLPVKPLLVIYTITWFLETVGLLFFWGLVGPAIVGGLVMGAFVLLGWQQQYSVNSKQ